MHTTTVAAACADLLFTARIRAVAERTGVGVAFLSARADPVARLSALRPRLLLLDLEAAWLDAAALITRLKADPGLAGMSVVGFGSHVHADAMRAARAAGADRVLARSAFVQQLPGLLSAIAAEGSGVDGG